MSKNKKYTRLQWWLPRPHLLFLRVLGEIYQRIFPNEPWISVWAVRYLAKNLKKNHIGFEWGSGRSTLWFSDHLGKLVSIEHDPTWHQIVSEKIKRKGAQNIDYRFVLLDHPENEPTYSHYDPLPKYVSNINDFPDESFDFILIDGHYRMACVLAALNKLKSGGYLTIDNSDWMPLENWGVPSNWPIAHRSQGFTSQTTIWKKP